MSVRISPYSPAWPELFAQEARLLQSHLRPWLTSGVQHVGSTAVPGLAAKPILDLLAPVADLRAARAAMPVLAQLGYRHAPHRPDEALWFFKQAGEAYESRTHQLHLTLEGSVLWRERLAFRDALRESAALRAEYAALKTGLSDAVDLVAYTDGKRDFVARVLADAGIQLG